jgi:hypothetical protein
MLPPASPFQRAIDYRQGFSQPEPAIQRFNPLAKMMEMFKPRAPQQPQMMEPPSAPVPMAPPYGEPPQQVPTPRPNPMAGMMSGMGDSGMGEILMALGTGIASGNLASGASMLPGLMERAASRKQYKNELKDSAASREQLAQMLEQKGETDLAAGVRGGYVDPEDAFDNYMKSAKEKQALENAPIKDEFGIERNKDGSFKNPYDERKYQMEMEKLEADRQERQGKISKGQMEMEKLKREQEQAQKAQELTAPKGAREASVGVAFDSIYKNLGIDPETGADLPEGSPRKSFIDKMIPDAMGDRATGMGSLLGVIPGTTARDLSADVDTLISEIITSEVAKLKAAGVSFGQITEYENKMFARLQGSLDLGQGREQVVRNIRVLDEAMRRAAETGQLLLENDPALQGIVNQPEQSEMSNPPPEQAPVEVRSEDEAMALPPGTVVILNGRRFRVE